MSLSPQILSWRRIRTMLLLALIIVPVSLAHTRGVQAAPDSGRAFIPGSLVPILQHHTPLHTLDGNRQLQLTISLQLRNQRQLHALLQAQNDPQSPWYHRYLTPQQFAHMFSPDQATVKKVVAYLHAQNLTVKAVSSNNTLISTSGTVAAIEKAFAVTLNNYNLNGRTVYAPASEPSVPNDLAGVLLNISGLDDVARYRPILRLGHTDSSDKGYTPDNIRTAYDIGSLIHASNGAGQTVALFELDGYNSNDVDTYLTRYKLGAPDYSDVLVDNALNTAGAGAIEVELDMEIVSAIAPGAAQKVYIGPNSSSGVIDTYNRIVTDDSAKVISTSWGLCETNSDSAQLTALDNVFKQGAAQGQAVFSASGDSGAYDCNTDALAVDSPSDDPYVVGVGGTNLQLGDKSDYGSEIAWSSTTETKFSAKGAGGGGGYSTVFRKPSYQTGTGVDTNIMRHVPDVAANADPATGYAISCTVLIAGCSYSGWATVGGTSAAAPLWAGIAADTNSYLFSQKKTTLGSASTTLYQLFNTKEKLSAYHDITGGDNLFYKAGPGYDLATGIGTPDAWNFARDAAALTSNRTSASPPAPTPTPAPTMHEQISV